MIILPNLENITALIDAYLPQINRNLNKKQILSLIEDRSVVLPDDLSFTNDKKKRIKIAKKLKTLFNIGSPIEILLGKNESQKKCECSSAGWLGHLDSITVRKDIMNDPICLFTNLACEAGMYLASGIHKPDNYEGLRQSGAYSIIWEPYYGDIVAIAYGFGVIMAMYAYHKDERGYTRNILPLEVIIRTTLQIEIAKKNKLPEWIYSLDKKLQDYFITDFRLLIK